MEIKYENVPKEWPPMLSRNVWDEEIMLALSSRAYDAYGHTNLHGRYAICAENIKVSYVLEDGNNAHGCRL